MNLEPGEYFIVTRGFKTSSMVSVFDFHEDGFMSTSESGEDKYDRSYEGRVYQVLGVCDSVISCKRVFGMKHFGESEHPILLLNLKEVEVFPCSKDFLMSVGIKQ